MCLSVVRPVFGAFYPSLSDLKSLKIQEFLMAAVMSLLPE